MLIHPLSPNLQQTKKNLMLTTHALLPLFQKFINHSKSGRRRNKNGIRIKPQSVANYSYCYKLLQGFEEIKKDALVLYQVKGNDKKEHNRLKKHYDHFYKQFTGYLYLQQKCHDNYVGQTIKQLRSFFVWCYHDQAIHTGTYYRSMYVCKEEVPIITLSLQQLHFLIHDKNFESSLSPALQKTKDIFVLGCIVGLRFCDMISIRKSNIFCMDNTWYLKMRSQKTSTDTLVKLPPAALAIIQNYQHNKAILFTSISLNQFNKNIKALALKAGWTQPVEKQRSRMGITTPVKDAIAGGRFCDYLSSHTMRRTSITTMLGSGMPEHVVRKISGHTSDSKAFFRYVNLAQSLMDTEIDKLHRHL